MQRRAAAMYFAFFVIVGAAAYGLIVTTSAPGVSVSGQDYTTGETVELGDRTWTVSSVSSGGSGELSWTNENGAVNTSIDNGTEVPPGALPWNETFQLVVRTENVTDPTEATFVEQRNRTALLAEDPTVYNEVNTVNGTKVVTYRANNTNVPLDEYLPPLERHTIAEGETLVYQGNETTVTEISNESVTLTRPAETTVTVGLREGENFTVGGETYFAHFPDNSTVRILPAEERYGDYRAELAAVESYNERVLGLWGIVDISIAAVVVLLATAFLPVRG